MTCRAITVPIFELKYCVLVEKIANTQYAFGHLGIPNLKMRLAAKQRLMLS